MFIVLWGEIIYMCKLLVPALSASKTNSLHVEFELLHQIFARILNILFTAQLVCSRSSRPKGSVIFFLSLFTGVFVWPLPTMHYNNSSLLSCTRTCCFPFLPSQLYFHNLFFSFLIFIAHQSLFPSSAPLFAPRHSLLPVPGLPWTAVARLSFSNARRIPTK